MNGMNGSVVEEAGRCSSETLCDYIYPHLSIWSHLTSSHAKTLFCWSLRYAYVGYEVDVK